MIEALRAFGYTTEAAIADLIDNSIAANARNIWLNFHWSGPDSYVSVRDDGDGMTEAALRNAMRPGSRSPLEERAPDDLGRFGLGLKTASFSQCRRLTVSSASSAGRRHVRRWDLDYVIETGEWRLLKQPAAGSKERLHHEGSGTVVLWEGLDRIVEDFSEEDVPAKKRFLELAESVENHIAMVFHRFLGSRRSVRIWIGNRRVRPWDPFLSREPATQRLTSEKLHLHGKTVTVTPFVLPHHSRLHRERHALAAGPRGWNAHQGFYIYRNERLLVAGDWLGLGFQKEEHYKLARIRVDIPNSMDSEWDIDVKKSRARPPGALRNDLRRVARATRERAVQVYRHRGRIIARSTSTGEIFVWSQHVKGGKVSYRLNRDHPLAKKVLSLAGARPLMTAFIRLVEETVPIPLIVLDSAERPDAQAVPFERAPSGDVSFVLKEMYKVLRGSGLTSLQARRRLSNMEPFDQFPELVAALDDEVAAMKEGR